MEAYYNNVNFFGPVAQWIEQLPSKQWVVGSIPARATILDTYLQEFTTFADFLLYVVKCCKNMLIAVRITAFLRHDYGRTQMQYEL